MNEPTRRRWTCPDCGTNWRIPAGQQPPDHCPRCRGFAAVVENAIGESANDSNAVWDPPPDPPEADPAFIEIAATPAPRRSSRRRRGPPTLWHTALVGGFFLLLGLARFQPEWAIVGVLVFIFGHIEAIRRMLWQQSTNDD